MYHILIVEDTPKIAQNMQTYLMNRGYRVTIAGTGEEALRLLQEQMYAVAVLDIMLPGIDGYEVCRYITEHTETGVIMATAKNTSKEKIAWLDLGADDYLGKPFELAELEARIRALLRRLQPQEKVILEQIIIDLSKNIVQVADQEIELTTKQRYLLEYLAKHQGIFISRTDLISSMRGDEEMFSGDEKLDVYINVLRKKIGKKYIQTRRGFGYRLISSLDDDDDA